MLIQNNKCKNLFWRIHWIYSVLCESAIDQNAYVPTITGTYWSSMLVGSSSPMLSRRSFCVPEVSQTGVLPHLVLCLPQMEGLGSSHVEDMTLIHHAFTWHSDMVLCNTSARKEEQCPQGIQKKHFETLRVWYSNSVTAMWGAVCPVEEGCRCISETFLSGCLSVCLTMSLTLWSLKFCSISSKVLLFMPRRQLVKNFVILAAHFWKMTSHLSSTE